MCPSPHISLISCIALGALLWLPVAAAECDPDRLLDGERQPDVRCSQIVTVAVDQKDRLWRLWADGQQLYVDFSSGDFSADNGHSFGSPMVVNTKPEPINTDPENRPRLGVFNDHIVVIWARPGEKRFTSDLRISRSADAGRTFSEPENVNQDGLEIGHSFADLSVGPNGNLLIAWLDGRDRHQAGQAGTPFAGTSLYFTRADAPDGPLQPEQSIARGSCECCRLAMDRDADGSPLVLWRHIFDGNIRDHAMGTWNDEGFSWRRASFEDWQIEACPHHGPAMAVSNHRIHAAWFSAAEQARGLFYRSFDLDFARASAESAHDASSVMAFGDLSRLPSRPALAVNGSDVVLAWQEFDGQQTQVRTRHSTDQGNSWSEPATLAMAPGTVDHPQLLVLAGRILLSWQVPGTGHALMELGR